MHILALDLAGRAGWARWHKDMTDPVWGVAKLPTASAGQTYAALRDFLLDKIIAEGVTHLAIEAPFVSPDTISSVERIYGLQGVAREIAYRRSCTVNAIPVGTWRKNFLGSAAAPKTVLKKNRSAWLKQAAVSECARRGWAVKTHDEADALGILVFERARLLPMWAMEGDLFGVGAAPASHPDSVRDAAL